MAKAFCPLCGTALLQKNIDKRRRAFCPKCVIPIYDNPLPATAALVYSPGKELLLVRRANEPGKGKWCLPGGFVEIDESPEECVLRELEEETGIQGRVHRLVSVEKSGSTLHPAVLVLGYEAGALSGKLRPGDDAVEAAYFPVTQLPEIAFASHQRIIARAIDSAHGQLELPKTVGVYVITSSDHLSIATAACQGGARIVQYRDKESGQAHLLETAREIRRITRACKTLFIMNDRIDIALLAEADGVHLGQDDLPLAEARRIVPDHFLIGISTHSLEQARAAASGGADYIGIGPVFATPTKKDYKPIGLNLVKRVLAEVGVPAVAIGGINGQNIQKLISVGVRNVAMVRALQEDTAATVAALNRLLL